MKLTGLLNDLKTLLARTVRERVTELDHPSGHEPGLRHRHNAGLVLCRDDGVVELSAGARAALLVDGPAQSVRAQGSAVVLAGNRVSIDSPGGLYVNQQRLNPYWLSGPLDPTFLTRAPLVLNTPVDLGTVICTLEPPVPPPGVVAPISPLLLSNGVVPRPLWTLMTPRPLFGPNEQYLILAENLGELMLGLAHTIGELDGE